MILLMNHKTHRRASSLVCIRFRTILRLLSLERHVWLGCNPGSVLSPYGRRTQASIDSIPEPAV